ARARARAGCSRLGRRRRPRSGGPLREDRDELAYRLAGVVAANQIADEDADPVAVLDDQAAWTRDLALVFRASSPSALRALDVALDPETLPLFLAVGEVGFDDLRVVDSRASGGPRGLENRVETDDDLSRSRKARHHVLGCPTNGRSFHEAHPAQQWKRCL